MAGVMNCFNSDATYFRFISETMVDSIGFMNFASYVKKHRDDLELTQEQLAEKSGINRSFIGLLESDGRTPPLSCLTQLADALKLTKKQRQRLHELAAIRHLKPGFRVIIEDALIRLDRFEARSAAKNQRDADTAAIKQNMAYEHQEETEQEHQRSSQPGQPTRSTRR